MDVQIAEQYIVYEDINMCPDDPSKWDDENNIPLEVRQNNGKKRIPNF